MEAKSECKAKLGSRFKEIHPKKGCTFSYQKTGSKLSTLEETALLFVFNIGLCQIPGARRHIGDYLYNTNLPPLNRFKH